MKKKVLALVAALLVFSTTSIFAFGIGLQFNGNAGKVFTMGPAVTVKFDACPLIFAANWNFGEDTTTIGVTGDYWILNDTITKIGSAPLNWFIGVGFFGNFIFADEFAMNCGLRVPVGLNMFIAKGVFEPFIQIAPSFGVQFVPSLGATDLFWPISAGFRIWFK